MLDINVFFEIYFFLQDLARYSLNIYLIEYMCMDNNVQYIHSQNHLNY